MFEILQLCLKNEKKPVEENSHISQKPTGMNINDKMTGIFFQEKL